MKVEIKGPIIDNDDQWIYDWFGYEATSPKKINDLISKTENNEDLEVEINSGGGSVFAGSEIYTNLESYAGNVTTKIVGIAASAASVVAMAGDKVLISPTAQMMIHNVSGSSQGDYNAMEKSAEILKNANQTIANAYALKTGLKNEDLLSMMDEEKWLTPQEALEKGFVDEIMFTDSIKLTNSIDKSGLLPRQVINKMKNELKSGKFKDHIKKEEEEKPKSLKNEEKDNVDEANRVILAEANALHEMFIYNSMKGSNVNE